MPTILFLGANPHDTQRLDLGWEVREITRRLRATTFAARFEVAQEWAVQADDIQAALLRHKPDIVHFSGHGEETRGLLVEDEQGRATLLDREALGALFGILSNRVCCVVLNACSSTGQAREIVRHVDCVVAMTRALEDRAAVTFAAAFYQALGFGETVNSAFELARNALDLKALPSGEIPCLLSRSGVDPGAIRFITDREPTNKPAAPSPRPSGDKALQEPTAAPTGARRLVMVALLAVLVPMILIMVMQSMTPTAATRWEETRADHRDGSSPAAPTSATPDASPSAEQSAPTSGTSSADAAAPGSSASAPPAQAAPGSQQQQPPRGIIEPIPDVSL